MANRFYPKGAERILRGEVDFSLDSIMVALVGDSYSYDAGHEFLSSVSDIVGTEQPLTNLSISGGVFDAADVSFGALPPGDTVGSLVIYRASGTAGTSPLLCFLDEVTGFPFATNGGDVHIPWSDGPAKIFSLV